MITIYGKNEIKATVVLDSISPEGNRLITFEIEYPRIVLSELNTHRMLSKNSASSRAIPFEKMLQSLKGAPVRFGQANKGMQDKGEDYNELIYTPCYEQQGYGEDAFWIPVQGVTNNIGAWNSAKCVAVDHAKGFYDAGYHKQVYNRLLEPFQMMKTVISGTEWANFFWLRDDDAADPTLRELARCMKEAYNKSIPQKLRHGEWHLPYVYYAEDDLGNDLMYFIGDVGQDSFTWLSLEDAIEVSCARACAVSFRNVDYGLEKCKEVYQRLISDSKIHGSALEHTAKVMKKSKHEYGDSSNDVHSGVNHPETPWTWENGVSHVDRDYNLWSGNFKGFIQHRKTIEGENHEG